MLNVMLHGGQGLRIGGPYVGWSWTEHGQSYTKDTGWRARSKRGVSMEIMVKDCARINDKP